MGISVLGGSAASGGGTAITDRGTEVIATYRGSGTNMVIDKIDLDNLYDYFFVFSFEAQANVPIWQVDSSSVLTTKIATISGNAGELKTLPISLELFGGGDKLFLESSFTGNIFIEKIAKATLASVASTSFTPSTFGGMTYTGPYYTHKPSTYVSTTPDSAAVGDQVFFIIGNGSAKDYLCRIINPAAPSLSIVRGSTYHDYYRLVSNNSHAFYYYGDAYYGGNNFFKHNGTSESVFSVPVITQSFDAYGDMLVIGSSTTVYWSYDNGGSWTSATTSATINDLWVYNSKIFFRSSSAIWVSTNDTYTTWEQVATFGTAGKIIKDEGTGVLFYVTTSSSTMSALNMSTNANFTVSLPTTTASNSAAKIQSNNGVYFYFPNAIQNSAGYYSSNLTSWTALTPPVSGQFISASVSSPSGLYIFYQQNVTAGKVSVNRTISIG